MIFCRTCKRFWDIPDNYWDKKQTLGFIQIHLDQGHKIEFLGNEELTIQ